MKSRDETLRESKKIFIISTTIIAVSSLAIFIPQIRELIIRFGELLIGRPLTHEVWHGRFIGWEKRFLVISIFVIFFPCIFTQVLESKQEIYLLEIIEKKEFLKCFCIFLIIFLLGILAIIRANFNYVDDLGRTIDGDRGWDDFSRYISNDLSVLIHTGTNLADISPLPQIIAVIFLSISGTLLLRILSDDKRFSIIKVFALVPIGLSPYFLQCLSYKFDSPYMALSILVCIIPFLFVPKDFVQIDGKESFKKTLHFYLPYFYFSLMGVLMMCLTYQAASGIYPILVGLIALKNWNKKKSFGVFLMVSISAYAMGIIIFKLFYMKIYDGYVSNRIAISSFFSNWKKYYALVKDDYKTWWNLLQICVVCLFPIVISKHSQRNKIIAFFAGVLAIMFVIIMAFGLYPLLSIPSYQPRAMYGLGVAFACVSFLVVDQTECFVCKIPSIIICWVFFVFSFIYGDALAEQKRYTDFRIQVLISDLESIPEFLTDEEKKIKLSGKIDLSPVLNNEAERFPIIKRLVPSTLGNGWWWSEYYFYYHFSLQNVINVSDDDLNESNMTILKNGMYYKIKGDGETFVVEIQ